MIDDAGNYPHDVRHLVNVAKSHGWDASTAAREAVVEQGEVPERYHDDENDELPRPADQDLTVAGGYYGTWEENKDGVR